MKQTISYYTSLKSEENILFGGLKIQYDTHKKKSKKKEKASW